MSGDNIKHLPGAKVPDTTEAFRQLVAEMRERKRYMIEYEQLRASITRAKYLELVAVGFTDAQALELCK